MTSELSNSVQQAKDVAANVVDEVAGHAKNAAIAIVDTLASTARDIATAVIDTAAAQTKSVAFTAIDRAIDLAEILTVRAQGAASGVTARLNGSTVRSA